MWKSEINELERRKKIARQLGGKENVAKHHKEGKMTVRDRQGKVFTALRAI